MSRRERENVNALNSFGIYLCNYLIDKKLGMISYAHILTSFLLSCRPCTKLPPTTVTKHEKKNTVMTSLLSTFYFMKVKIQAI